jgi:phage terminase large subunit-like protein
MATAEITLPRPFAYQREVLSLVRAGVSCVIFGGRRVGKTQLGVLALLEAATREVGLYWWIGLSWRSASLKRAWRLLKFYVRKIYRALGMDASRAIRESDKELLLPNGSAIWLRSAERPDSLAGEAVRGAVVDEFSLMPENLWTEYLEAALMDLLGWGLFLGVPKGQNWAAKLWYQAHDRPGWRAFRWRSADNPRNTAERLADIRAHNTERIWRQEYEADILADGGAVFRNLDVACVLAPAEPYRGRFIMGVDWARSNDYTVLSVIDAQTQQQVALDRFNQIGWSLQRKRLRALYELWKPELIMAESNSIGSPNIEALQMEGLPVVPFETTAATKGPLIEGLSLALEQGAITLLADDIQKNELESYELRRLPSGHYKYDAPEGLHDDTVIALALAWHGVNVPLARVRKGLY